MSRSRQELIAQYDIQEPGLKALIDALCEKEECVFNYGMIKRAVEGYYSERGTSEFDDDFAYEDDDDRYDPKKMLIYDLSFLYFDLIPHAKAGVYNHDLAPAPSEKHSDRAAAEKIRSDQMQLKHSLVSIFRLFLAERPKPEKRKPYVSVFLKEPGTK